MCIFLQEVAEPLQDLKQGLEELKKNKTFKYILATLLKVGNYLNGIEVSNINHLLIDWFSLGCRGLCLISVNTEQCSVKGKS